jgi:hypothetical protein
MMKTILVAATAALMSTSAFAQDAITEFRIGMLGGENAQTACAPTSACAPMPRTCWASGQAVYPGRL